jgi:hypothetical protein
MFNNSIPNSTEFNTLFSNHKNTIQIVQFQCLPNFFKKTKKDRDYLIGYNEMKKKYGIWSFNHFNFFALNECFLTNSDKYSYISVNDPDETVIPRKSLDLNQNAGFKHYKNENKIETKQDLLSRENETTCYKYAVDLDQTSLKIYLNNLKMQTKNNNNKKSFYFKMGVYMKHETIAVVFQELKNLFDNFKNDSNFDYIIDIKSGRMSFKLSIKDKDDYLYAKYLYELYLRQIMPYLKKNKNRLKKISDAYNRFYYVLGSKSTYYFAGKTIYNTNRDSNRVSVHSPVSKQDLMWVMPDSGHSSHFRSNYNLRPNTYPIKELNYDENYFNCYFKPILNKIS